MNWDSIWKEKRYISDFELRWYGFLKVQSGNLAKDSRILEAGCGSGDGLMNFTGGKRLAIGVDISHEACKKTKDKGSVRAVLGDNKSLPFSSDQFDVVFNSGVIEHYRYPGNLNQVLEMKRVTRPGGQVIINVPNALCLWYQAVKVILKFLGSWKYGYEEGYTPWRLKRIMREAGLDVRGMTGFQFLPPMAIHTVQFLPQSFRRIIAGIEKIMPLKQYYCYTVCAIARKG